MKKLLLTTAALLAFAAAGSAGAADLPATPIYKAPIVTPVPAARISRPALPLFAPA